MAEKVLKIKAVSDVSDATAGLAAIGDSLEKTGTAALQAAERSKAEWKALEQQWREANPTLKGIADAAFAAESALNKAARTDDVGRLTAELVKAQVAVDGFRAKLAQVEASGGVVDEKTLSTLKAYDEGIDALKGKMQLLATAQEEARQKILGGAEGMSSLAKAAREATDATEALTTVRGPEQLEGAIKRGAWASLQLREELDRAAAAGEKIDDKTVAALKAVETQTQASIEKMTRFRKEMADSGDNAKLATDRLDAMKNAGGGLGSVFERLEKGGGGMAKAIGGAGIALGALGAAVTGAIASGKELAEGIDKLSEKYAKLQQKQIDQKIRLQEQDIATRAADRGLIEHGKTIDETVANYNKFAVAQGKLSESNRKFIEGVAGLKVPPTFEDLARQVDAIKIAFEGAYKRGDEFGNRMLVENGQILTELRQKYIDIGQAVPPEIQKLVDKLDALKTAGEAAAGGVDQAAEKVMTLAEAASQTGPSLDGMRERIMDLSKASDVAAAINAKYRDQLKETAPALNEFGRNAFDQERWDENTADITRSTQALKDQNFALQEGFDAWETAGIAMGKFSVDVRQATKDYVETGDAALDLIEKMARANDKLGDLAVFAGSWIAELEKGNITTGEFRKKLDELSVGLPYYSALLRAAGVDAAETSAAISEMYAALNDATFMEPAIKWWEKLGVAMSSAFFKARDEAKKLKEELEVVEVVAGRVNTLVGGPMGVTPQELEDGYTRPKPENMHTR